MGRLWLIADGFVDFVGFNSAYHRPCHFALCVEHDKRWHGAGVEARGVELTDLALDVKANYVCLVFGVRFDTVHDRLGGDAGESVFGLKFDQRGFA